MKAIVSGTPIPCKNITINAYLVPLQDEVRDRTLTLCRDAEVDVLSHVYFAPHWVEEDHNFENYKRLMADASAYGLPVLTMDVFLQHVLDHTPEEVAAFAESYKSLPGFGGFFVVDEPVNPNTYAWVENTLREVCPDTRVNVNFLPLGCYPEGVYIRQLTDYGSLLRHGGTLSLDTYCFPENGGVAEMHLFNNYDALRTAGLRTGCNTAVYVQSVGMKNGYRRPSGDDVRYNMMAALAYGIKELKFFCWGTPPDDEGPYTEAILDRSYLPTPLYADVCRINHKIHAFGAVLARCDAVEVYHARNALEGVYEKAPDDLFVRTDADVILSLMKERGGDAEYLYVVNKDITAPQTVTLTFDGLTGVGLIDPDDGHLIPSVLTDGSYTETLAPGDALLLTLPEGNHFPSDVTAEPCPLSDLAEDAPVTASSSEGSAGLYLWNLTHDGDTRGARLYARDGSDQWLTVDLGEIRQINRVELHPAGEGKTCGARMPGQFTLAVSSDGQAWTDVLSSASLTLDRREVPILRFAEVDAKYVRLTVTGLTPPLSSFELGRVRVFLDDGSLPDIIPTSYEESTFTEAADLALCKPVVGYSSTTDEPSWTCHHSFITDGTPSTAWASALRRHDVPDAEEWIVIDLCDTYTIHGVRLTPREPENGTNVFPEDYEIRVSTDGRDFRTAASVRGDNIPQSQQPRELTFDPVPARYVELLATRLTHASAPDGGYMIEITELEVFGQ